MRNADSKNELRLRIKLESKRDKTVAADDAGGLTRHGRREEGGACVLDAQAPMNVQPLFNLMVEKRASDLFLTCFAPVKIKIDGKIIPVNKLELTPQMVRQAAMEVMTGEQLEEFNRELEIDFAVSKPGLGRFRVNVFHQRGNVALVMRYITARPAGPRRARHAADPEGSGDVPARAAPDGRRHRLRQVHDPGRDDQLPEREDGLAHHHHRGPDRVPAHEQEVHREPAGSRHGHQVLRPGAEERDARSTGRDPGRRDARPGDHADHHRSRRHRASVRCHAALEQRAGDAGPDHQPVPGRPARAGLHGPVPVPAGDHFPAPGARHRRPAGGCRRGHAEHAAHRRADPARRRQQGEGVLPREHASRACRPSTSRCSSSTRTARSPWKRRWRTPIPARTSRRRFTSRRRSPRRTQARRRTPASSAAGHPPGPAPRSPHNPRPRRP